MYNILYILLYKYLSILFIIYIIYISYEIKTLPSLRPLHSQPVTFLGGCLKESSSQVHFSVTLTQFHTSFPSLQLNQPQVDFAISLL